MRAIMRVIMRVISGTEATVVFSVGASDHAGAAQPISPMRRTGRRRLTLQPFCLKPIRTSPSAHQPTVASATTSNALLLPPKPLSVPDGIWPKKLESELTDAEYARILDELDRLLNDPDVPIEPTKVWSLLAVIAHQDRDSARGAEPGSGQQGEPH
jgi:hypothetical protein